MRLALAIVVVVLGFAGTAKAWSCVAPGCPDWCEAPGYLIGRLSDDLETSAPGTTVAELTRAMDDWGLVSCGALDPIYLGTTSATAASGDGMNVVEVIDASWPYDANVIGMSTRVLANGCIVESDIVLNGENYDLVTRPGYRNEIHAYSAALHEAGHFYGLGHSQYVTSVMYYRYGAGTREISADDEQGICFLYPGSDPPPDCAVTGCPSGQICDTGVCVDAPTPACTSDFDCASFQACNLATGVCETKSGSGSDLGVDCSVDSDCASGICQPTATSPVCSQTCDAGNPHSCPTGFYCSGDAITDCAIGVCLPGAMGTGAFLSPCSMATECSSLYCSPGGYCSVPCERGVATACPGGSNFICHPSTLAACGFCGRPTSLGGECTESAECDSLLCFDDDLDGRGVCADECSVDADCPDGFECTDAGGTTLCLAPPHRRGRGCSVGTEGGGARREGAVLFGLLTLFCVTLLGRRATKRRWPLLP